MPVTTLFVIDTAADRCSLALARDGALDQVCGAPGDTHLEHVMPMIEAIFSRNGLTPAQCDAFAFGSGPGSFTGLRVACTMAQGLALGAGRPVVAVGNLLALACRGAQQAPAGAALAGGPRAQRVLAALDARMGQAYVAVYEGAGTDWRELLAPALVDAGALASIAAQWQPDLCAGEAAWLERTLGAPMTGGAGILVDTRADAGTLAVLAVAALARGEALAPERAVPHYVRDDVARTVAQRRAGLAAAP